MRSLVKMMTLLVVSASGCDAVADTDEDALESRLRCGIVDLGVLPGDIGSAAASINKHGEVVGYSWSRNSSTPIPFEWSRRTGMTALPVRPGPKEFAKPTGINDAGQIVGTLFGLGNDEAVRWEDGEIAAIECAGGEGGASGINRAGQFVGWCSPSPAAPTRAYRWSEDEALELAPLPGLTQSIALAVNDHGVVVGSSYWRGDDELPTLWTKRGAPVNLGAPAQGVLAHARDINERGEIAVYASSNLRSYRFADGVYTDLGTVEGTTTTYAEAINNRGQIVGLSDVWGNPRAFLWQDDEIIDLDELLPAGSGWSLTNASDIDDAGRIVGEGVIDGVTRAFLLTPCR